MARGVKSYSDLELQNAGIVYGTDLTEFPTSPKAGTTIMKDGVQYCYSTIRGVQTWHPLNSKYSSYVHTQGLASQTWTVAHNFESEQLIYFIYDSTGAIVFAEPTFTDLNTMTLTFTEDITGRVIVFAMTEMYSNTITTTSANIGGVIIADGSVQANNILSAVAVSDETQLPAGLPSGTMVFNKTSNSRLRFFNTTNVGQTLFDSMQELTPFRSGVLTWYYKATGGETLISLPAGYDYLPEAGEIEVEVEGNPVYLINGEFAETSTTSITLDNAMVANEILTIKIRHS